MNEIKTPSNIHRLGYKNCCQLNPIHNVVQCGADHLPRSCVCQILINKDKSESFIRDSNCKIKVQEKKYE